jgi:hypothetical protein
LVWQFDPSTHETTFKQDVLAGSPLRVGCVIPPGPVSPHS